MGFLDHSTNNIIVDAVLTDRGRQALAEGQFNVDSFSLGDDEVDYTVIQKFGRTVGKEKIIKNTPIFEAQTGSELGLKYKVLTLSDPSVIYLPTVSLSGDVVGNTVTITASTGTTTGNSQSVTLTVNSQGVTDPANKFPIDNIFYVEVPNRFLSLTQGGTITNATDSRINQSTQTAVYSLSSALQNNGLPELTLTLSSKGLDDTMFNTFGTTTAKDRIDCVVSATGKSTGLRTTFNVIINKS
jgi:hypothetical protein